MYEKNIQSNPDWIDAQLNLIRRYLISSVKSYQLVGVSIYESSEPTEVTTTLSGSDSTPQNIAIKIKTSGACINLDPTRPASEQGWQLADSTQDIFKKIISLENLKSLTINDLNTESEPILCGFANNIILASWANPRSIKIELFVKLLSSRITDNEARSYFADRLTKVMPLQASNFTNLPLCTRTSNNEINISWNIPDRMHSEIDAQLRNLPKIVFPEFL